MYNVPKGKMSQFIFLALPLVNFLNKKLAVLSYDNTKKNPNYFGRLIVYIHNSQG